MSVRKPKTAEKRAPTRTAANNPSHAEPVICAMAKPDTAPISIMPSTPRLSTPERSTTSSPMAAIRSGVAAVAIVRRIACVKSMRSGLSRSGCGYEPNTIEDERIAGEHEEQDHALKHARGFFRDADGHLCGLTAKIGKRQHQTG